MSDQILQRVLVTGASGYIASHIIKLLLDHGYMVRGTVRNLHNQKKIAPLKQLSPKAQENLELVEADLLKPENWQNAVGGCDFVIHTASPFPSVEPAHPNEDLIKPAVEGTLQILRACASAGSTVKRVILTSSIAAVFGDGNLSKLYNEDDWTDPANQKLISYTKSKTLAEKSAWDFMKENHPKFELSVINPGFVMGPLIHDSDCTSAELLQRILSGVPMVARVSFAVVDVRDVAEAHLKAMTEPAAAGKRHIVVNRTMWVIDIAHIVGEEFRPLGYRVPSMAAPYPFVWAMSFLDKGIKLILNSIGKFIEFDNSRMKNVLEIEPRDIRSTINDMAYSLVDRGFIKRTQKYKSPVAK